MFVAGNDVPNGCEVNNGAMMNNSSEDSNAGESKRRSLIMPGAAASAASAASTGINMLKKPLNVAGSMMTNKLKAASSKLEIGSQDTINNLKIDQQPNSQSLNHLVINSDLEVSEYIPTVFKDI